ncbi:MAG: hypothetical protein COA92_02975 [Sulfurovum sp.]|nr:MAG: hypothetical protein COA92_02975 [Sulfurovum sp.]
MVNDNLSEYARKLALLRKEISEIHTALRKKKKVFNENQQRVYDFIISKKDIIQFTINNKQYFIKKGNEDKGFMHILLNIMVKSAKVGLLLITF